LKQRSGQRIETVKYAQPLDHGRAAGQVALK